MDPDRRIAVRLGIATRRRRAPHQRLRGVRFLYARRGSRRHLRRFVRRGPHVARRTVSDRRAWRRSPSDSAAVVRGRLQRRAAHGHGDPAGDVPHVRRHGADTGRAPARASSARARVPCAPFAGTWCSPAAAPRAAAAVSSVRGRASRARAPARKRGRDAVQVRIPAGVADGDRVRVPAKGNAGVRGGEPGDLYITCRSRRIRSFAARATTCHMIVPIAIHEAALGARIDIPTPGRRREAARASGHAVGAAFPAARARRALDARRPPRRSRRRGEAGAAEAARRALEGAAPRVRPHQRRKRPRVFWRDRPRSHGDTETQHMNLRASVSPRPVGQ